MSLALVLVAGPGCKASPRGTGGTTADAGGTAASSADGLAAPPRVPGAMWTFPGPGQVEPPIPHPAGGYPALRLEPHLVGADGTVFLERWFPPRVTCLDGATGTVRWEHAMPPVLDAAGRPRVPSWSDGRMRAVLGDRAVVVLLPRDQGASLVALAAADGKTLWEHPLARPEQGAAWRQEGSLLLGAITGGEAADDELVVLSTADGAALWRWRLGPACPAFAASKIARPSHGDFGLDAIRLLQGRLLVRTACENPGFHVVASMLDASTGRALWQKKLATETDLIWVAPDRLYASSAPDPPGQPPVPGLDDAPSEFRGLDPATGATLWRTTNAVTLPGPAAETPRVVAVGPTGVRFFEVIVQTPDNSPGFHEFGFVRTPHWVAVEERSPRVIEQPGALPSGLVTAAPPYHAEPAGLQSVTPLADGSSIVRDQGAGSLARMPPQTPPRRGR